METEPDTRDFQLDFDKTLAMGEGLTYGIPHPEMESPSLAFKQNRSFFFIYIYT